MSLSLLRFATALCGTLLLAPTWAAGTVQAQVVRVELSYRAPTDGTPKPNFSPKGMQVPLTLVGGDVVLPPGAVRPAKRGVMQVGAGERDWIPILATASAEFPTDLVQLFVDRNRNGNFADDGPALTTAPAQNAKTKAWWSSISKVELTVSYGVGKPTQPYFVNFWSVREDSTATPDIIRFSTGSWRYGTATINGVKALVAAMDGDNNARFTKDDMWSVLSASAPDAEKAVLSLDEARATNRLMFVNTGAKDIPLEFRSFSADGRAVTFAIVPRPITKVADRAPDDMVRDERPRPRTDTPVTWGKELPDALAQAKSAGKLVLIDFEATWCGPCHTMDQWVWNDVDVAQRINAGFVGIKVDADLQKALVKRLKIVSYPTMMVMDADGNEVRRAEGYLGSKGILAFLEPR